MIGIVLVTHGRLADEFLSAMQHIVGPQNQIATACIGHNDDMNERRNDILNKVQAVDSGDGGIVVTDMFGGTPSNLAISIMDRANIEVIAGINLPMLVKLNTLRKEKGLKEAVTVAKEAGIKYITIASELLGK